MNNSKNKSRFWKDMFVFRKSNKIDSNQVGSNQIVSDEPPIAFPSNTFPSNTFPSNTFPSNTFLSNDPIKSCTIKSYVHARQYMNELEPLLGDIVEFLKKNNRMYTGIYELTDIDTLRNLIESYDTYLFLLYFHTTNDKPGYLIGIMMASMMTINVPEQNQPINQPINQSNKQKFALTYNLCVHDKVREKGVCMMLIRKGLQEAYANGILCGYYLEQKSISDCSVKVERWMRPINVQSALSHGYKFAMPKKSEKLKTKYAYSINKNPEFKVLRLTCDDIDITHRFLCGCKCKNESETGNETENDCDCGCKNECKNERNNNKLQWCPTVEEWSQIITMNVETPFHIVKVINSKREIQGIWVLQKKTIYIPETQCNSNVVHVAFEISKNQSLCLEAILWYVLNKMQSVDVMYMFQMGTLTREVLEKNKAVETGEMYLDFYNFINKQTLPKNIHLFLL